MPPLASLVHEAFSTAPYAGDGPLLVSTIVSVIWCPGTTGLGDALARVPRTTTTSCGAVVDRALREVQVTHRRRRRQREPRADKTIVGADKRNAESASGRSPRGVIERQ